MRGYVPELWASSPFRLNGNHRSTFRVEAIDDRPELKLRADNSSTLKAHSFERFSRLEPT